MTEKKTIRIAFVTPIYLPANLYGSDTFVRELSEAFARTGYDTSVITSDAMSPMQWYLPTAGRIPVKYEVLHGVKVYRLGTNGLFSLLCFLLVRCVGVLLPESWVDLLRVMYSGPALRGLDRLLTSKQFDVIHCSPFPLFLNKQVEDVIKSRSLTSQILLTPFFHTKVDEYQNKELGNILLRADTIHAVTGSEKKDLIRMHGVHARRVHVIPLFLNTYAMHEIQELRNDIAAFRKKHGLGGKQIVLFAGLKGEMKGALDVLAVMEEMNREDSSYVLIAIGHNTAEWDRVKKRMNPQSLIDLGYKQGKEKEIIFGACDIFCMPSRSDSFGLVYLEAWHKKKPVIGADIPAMRELFSKTNGGVLIPFGDRKKLKRAIEELATNPVLSESLGNKGYRSVLANFSLHTVFPAYRRLFERSSIAS